MSKKKIAAVACLVASLLLMSLPNGIAMTFAPSPTDRVTSYYSYFSQMPFGYGNWWPIITGILSAAAVVLILISARKSVSKALMTCLGICMAASLLSWLWFGSFTIVGLLVFVLHAATLAVQLSARKPAN